MLWQCGMLRIYCVELQTYVLNIRDSSRNSYESNISQRKRFHVVISRKHFYPTHNCFQCSSTWIIEKVNFINKDESNVREETQSTTFYTMSTHRIKFLHVLQFQ